VSHEIRGEDSASRCSAQTERIRFSEIKSFCECVLISSEFSAILPEVKMWEGYSKELLCVRAAVKLMNIFALQKRLMKNFQHHPHQSNICGIVFSLTSISAIKFR
jgi:hypothetical protein